MTHVNHRLAAWLAGELDPAARDECERHLAECPACAREAEDARRIWDQVGAVPEPAADRSRVWPAVRARTFGAGRAERAWFFGARPWTRRGWAACAVAAGLATGMLLPGLWTAGAVEADPQDPRLAGTSWQEEESSTDLATWWLAADFDEEDGS